MTSLYAKGMSVRDIARHVRQTTGVDLSHDTVSRVTDQALDAMREWQHRPLGPFYPVIYIDALVARVRDGSAVSLLRAWLSARDLLLQGLLDHLATLTRNEIRFVGTPPGLSPSSPSPPASNARHSTSSTPRSRSRCASSQNTPARSARKPRPAAVPAPQLPVTSG